MISNENNFEELNKTYSYHNNYDKKIRWIQYHTQIDTVLKLSPSNLLEIGIGSGVVSNYLKKYIKVHTFDINRNLNPDTVGSVENLSKYFKNNQFDVVLCSQMLEHIPYNKFDDCLKQIFNISKRFVILSLPHAAIHLRGNIAVMKNAKINFNITIPKPIKHKFYKGHYWEIGKLGFSRSKIRKHLKEYFNILNEFGMQEDPYYRFYVMEKKNDKRKM